MYDVVYLVLWVTGPAISYFLYDWVGLVGAIGLVYGMLNILPLAFGLQPMNGRDSLFLYDTSRNKLIVSSTCIFAEKVSVKQYKACAKKCLEVEKRCKMKIVKYFGRYYWKEDKDYRDENHYFVYSEKINKSYLENFLSNISTKDINFDHPPYEIHCFLNYENNKSAFVLRFHHSFCDGLAIVSMLTWCADEGSCKSFYSPKDLPFLKKIVLYILTALTMIYYFISTLLQKKDVNSLNSQKLSGRKSISWTNKIHLKGILNYCHQRKLTFNDYLTAVVLESLHQYSGTNLGTITATIPFSLRGQPKDGSFLKLENDLSIFPIEFPEVSPSLPEDCAKIFNSLKNSIKPFVLSQIMRLGVTVLPGFIMKFMVFYVVNKATMLFSNVGGPKGPVFFSGKKFDQFIGMSPNMASCGISVTCFSYTDHFIITCYADRNIIPKPKQFLNIIEEKLKKINKPNLD